MNEEVLILDIIPLNVGEMYPNKDEIKHYKVENIKNSDIDFIKNGLIEALKLQFKNYNTVIILEKGKVVTII